MGKPWKMISVVSMALGLVLLAGCGGGDAETPVPEQTTLPPSSTTSTVAPPPTTSSGTQVVPIPRVVGMDLQEAQDALQAAGFYVLTSHDALRQGRNQVLDNNWKVCDQTPAAGQAVRKDTKVDLGAVRDEETCP